MKSDFKIENKEKEVFSNLKPNYSQSKKEVWNKINILIDQDNDRASLSSGFNISFVNLQIPLRLLAWFTSRYLMKKNIK